MRPSQVIITLEAVTNTSLRPLKRNGARLSDRDAQTVKEVYQQWVLLLLDLGFLSHDEFKTDAKRLLEPMFDQDVFKCLQFFADCLQEVYNARIASYDTGFKALCKSISPRLYSLIKKDVLSASEGDVYSMQRLIQVFAYPSRLSLVDIDLTSECLNDYLSIEDSINRDYPKSYINALNKVIRRWFRRIDFDDLDFNHGPGGVAGLGRTSLEIKYYNLTTDPLTRYSFPDFDPPVFHKRHVGIYPQHPIRSELCRISTTIFVPKSYKTFRTISMETPTLMFLQQGVWNRIDQYVNRFPYLRNRIGFHDQSRNQDLARRGSIERSFATIDLSAASDSVSWHLVKQLFRGTKVLRYLFSCRSTHTILPDGRYIELKKFAPMGSALCFPIETIIFAAICEFVTHEHDFSGNYSVFGDDIIVPTECVGDMFHVLTSLGFTPNQSKSFYKKDCAFRESCGGEYFDGFDVTPIRVSRKYSSELTDVGCSGIVDMMNTSYQRGYRYLRSFLWSKLRGHKDFIPYFSPSSLLSDNYTNYHTKKRWSKSYQRVEFEVSTLVVSPDSRHDEIAYYDNLMRQKRSSSPARTSLDKVYEEYGNFIPRYDRDSVLRTGKPVVKLRRRWAPAPYDAANLDIATTYVLHHHGVELEPRSALDLVVLPQGT